MQLIEIAGKDFSGVITRSTSLHVKCTFTRNALNFIFDSHFRLTTGRVCILIRIKAVIQWMGTVPDLIFAASSFAFAILAS